MALVVYSVTHKQFHISSASTFVKADDMQTNCICILVVQWCGLLNWGYQAIYPCITQVTFLVGFDASQITRITCSKKNGNTQVTANIWSIRKMVHGVNKYPFWFFHIRYIFAVTCVLCKKITQLIYAHCFASKNAKKVTCVSPFFTRVSRQKNKPDAMTPGLL